MFKGPTVAELNESRPADCAFMVGYLRATIRRTGVITVADWNEAIEEERADQARPVPEPDIQGHVLDCPLCGAQLAVQPSRRLWHLEHHADGSHTATPEPDVSEEAGR